MSQFIFGNKNVSIPSSYSRIVSGVKNPPSPLGFGALLVIDAGSGATWGGGSGVDGAQKSGIDSQYTFDNIRDFQEFVKGGLWYDLANPLFKPDGFASTGVSTITFIRAATTVAGTVDFEPTGGGAAGGSITFTTVDEGLNVNGAVTSGIITKGYAFKMEVGVIDTAKFRLVFSRSSYKGTDPTGDEIGVAAANTTNEIIAISDEFDNIADLKAWADSDANFQKYFSVSAYTLTGTGAVTAADQTTYAAYTAGLVADGTETYDVAGLTAALDSIAEQNYDFILCDDYGDDAQGASNTSIVATVASELQVKPDVYVGGGVDSTKWTQANGSIPTAQYFDSQYVTVVHGGIKKTNSTRSALKTLPAIYKAAYVLGREAGLQPQVPTTFKSINIEGEAHSLTIKEAELGLTEGVLMTRFTNGSFDIVKGVNSLQNNKFLLNEDGTTPSKQIRRIVRQINKELIVNSKAQLLKQENGVNRNTLSPEDLQNWVEGYLSLKTATPNQDNLILSFENVTVERNQDAYFVSYGVVLNTEISFLFFTGTVIEI